VLDVVHVFKTLPGPDGPRTILADVSLRLARGDTVAVTGPAGSGKSTLVRVVGALDPPGGGQVVIGGTSAYTLRNRARAAFRNRTVGFVFEDPGLLPQCSLLENVLTPTLVARQPGHGDEVVIARARVLLERVGLGARIDQRPDQLSTADRQRGALARALIQQPVLLLCDEPTGRMEQSAAREFMTLLLALSASERTITIVTTRAVERAAGCAATCTLRDGILVES
jgi:lipoprotein-releasing system ATP-binding protein